MKKIFILIILLGSFINNGFSQRPIFKTGIYLVDYKTDFYRIHLGKCRLIIRDSSYVMQSAIDTVTGTITRLDENTFVFKKDKRYEYERTGIDKILYDSFGDECIEILSRLGNRFRFRTTYEAQLGITINEGIIRRKLLNDGL